MTAGAPQLEELLTPLQDYTRLHAATLRRFGSRTVDLSFPNPQFLNDPRPYQILADLAALCGPADLRYSPFGGFTIVRRRLAAALSRDHDLPYQRHCVIMTPGASAALHLALDALFSPPDTVMLTRPCWMDYPLYLAHLGLPCDIVDTTPDKHLDVERIERTWTPQTRALILSQPASPTGVLHTGSELTALAELLHRLGSRAGRPVVLIADEAHAGHVWGDIVCPAPAAYYPNTITVRSVSKTWDMQGQRCGYLALSPGFTALDQAATRLEQAMRISGQCAPTALMQHLAAELADLAPDHTALADLQRSTRHDLDAAGISALPAEATRFIYARNPSRHTAGFVTRLADRGVLVMPSPLFHEPGWFRLSLNVPATGLRRAVTIIGEVAHDA